MNEQKVRLALVLADYALAGCNMNRAFIRKKIKEALSDTSVDVENYEAMHKRAQSIKMRRLEIAAILTERKRAFFVEGVEHPFEDRVTLEAEDAELALEAKVLGVKTEAINLERSRRKHATLFAQLLVLLNEHGMGALVDEAEQRSTLAIAEMPQ